MKLIREQLQGKRTFWPTRRPQDGSGSSRIYALAAAVAIAVMCFRIILTYTTLTQTWDEPFHLACGMEWLDKHVYRYEAQHPPLSRIAAALGPYLASERSHGIADLAEEGNAILGDGARYKRNLALARLGELPFVVLACLGVWSWTRHYFGLDAAFASVLLFSMLPPVLAHGGLATTDMAVTATCTWALYCFLRFLEQQTWRTSVALGLACGLALVSKFTSLLFLGFGFPVTVAVFIACKRESIALRQLFVKRFAGHLASAVMISCLVVWSCYRFAFAPLFSTEELQKRAANFAPILTQRGIVHSLVTTIPVPAGQFFRGLGQVWRHNDAGQESFLLGEKRSTGWWYFFPTVFAVKTPIGFLLLVLLGTAQALRDLRHGEWRTGAPALLALIVMLVCLPARINIGVRHILPIYPLTSITAGLVIATSVRRIRPAWTALVGCLALWCCVASLVAHPDYVAYFNELASRHPERIRVDSDLDWGQDLGRLSARLQKLHAPSVALTYFGTADLARFELPPVTPISCDEPLHGYVAASVTNLYVMRMALSVPQPVGSKCSQRLEELQHIEPRERVGKSIFLYYFPPEP